MLKIIRKKSYMAHLLNFSQIIRKNALGIPYEKKTPNNLYYTLLGQECPSYGKHLWCFYLRYYSSGIWFSNISKKLSPILKVSVNCPEIVGAEILFGALIILFPVKTLASSHRFC